jgi:anti-sigma factor RsiW
MADLSCDRVVDLLGDYCEQVLASEERRAVDAHLVVCRRCGDALAEYQRIPALVRRATDVLMPVAAQARLRRLLSRAWRSRN